MTIFQILLTFLIVFAVFTGIAFLLNFCRRRLRKTGHGLTGMCHKNGGGICSTCRDRDEKK
ncbi:MAG: hypothetical protein SCH71_04515 [Desulfobulbaceae bacterium]|nr:hypothetical protein [Desulfobulbaceae bacterium]